MNGLSPRSATLTARQMQTSAAISKALPEFPTTVSDLISQMAVPNYLLALQAPKLDEAGEFVETTENLEIAATIELALIAHRPECDPSIKSVIFWSACELYRPGATGIAYLQRIINRLRESGQTINLDHVALNHLDMTKTGVTDLSGMSARKASFINVNMPNVKMHGADFTGALFINTILRSANLQAARLDGARFNNVEYSNSPIR